MEHQPSRPADAGRYPNKGNRALCKFVAAAVMSIVVPGCASLSLDDSARGRRDASALVADGTLCVVIDRNFVPEPGASFVVEHRRMLEAKYGIECAPLYLEADEYIDSYRDTMNEAIAERFGDSFLSDTFDDAVETVERSPAFDSDSQNDG